MLHADESEGISSKDNGDINGALREILAELKGQKNELNSLKLEVRENSVSSNDLKKLKVEKDIKWKFEGNRLQYEFKSATDDIVKQVEWAIQHQKSEYAAELCKEVREKFRLRNKLIRLADSSEAGWATVHEYESNPLASDSDDESRITKAESRAIKKRKLKTSSKKKARPAVAYGYSDSMAINRGYNANSPIPGGSSIYGGRMQSFRGYQSFPGSARATMPFVQGPCFACGEANHLRRNCPYINKDSRLDQPAKK